MYRALSLLLVCVSCSLDSAPAAQLTPPAPLPPEQVAPYSLCASQACHTGLITKFHLASPYWTSGTVFAEPVLPTAGRHLLWQPATRIVRVELPATGQVFEQGSDYRLIDGAIEFLAKGRIPVQSWEWLHRTEPGSPNYDLAQSITPGVRVRVSPDYDAYQVRVTYETPSREEPFTSLRTLPRLQRLLTSRHYVRITFYGDSITTGANATGVYTAPNQPGFATLTVAALTREYPNQILWRNVSQPGWAADAGASHAAEHVSGGQDDVVVVGFGTNDASQGRSPEAFAADLRSIIQSVHAANRETEIVLIAGSTTNPEWAQSNIALQRAYRDAMLEIQRTSPQVSVLDMTALWDRLLSRKAYPDLTGNGINHPNDFGHWLYAVALSEGLSQ